MEKRPIFRDPELDLLFQEQGYVTYNLITPDEAEELRATYHELLNDLKGQQFHSTMMVNDAEYRRVVDERIKQMIQPLLNQIMQNYKILFANYIIKESGPQTEVPVHQDWDYVDETKFDSVNVWFPLVDTNIQNGALHVLAGSHKLKTPVRYTPYFSYSYEPMFPDIKEFSIPVMAKAGEAVIYNSRLIHFSPPNLSGKTREAVGMVTVPGEAKPIHLFRPDLEAPEVEVYEVDEAFFHDFKIGERPRAEKNGILTWDPECFTADDLRKKYAPKKGVLTRLRSAFSFSKEK